MRRTMLESVKFWSATILLSLLAVAGLAPTPSLAQSQAQDPNAAVAPTQIDPLGPEEQKILLAEIEAYFDGVETLKSRFVQYNMDGSLYRGNVYLQRPGLMRIDYDPPIPYKVIADGTFYIFVDEELEQASYIPLGLTPANILLRRPMHLGEDLAVQDAARASGALFITLTQKEARDSGNLTLVFTENPLQLRQWTVIDAQGIVTRVVLQDPQIDVPLDRDLFRFVNPWSEREGGN